MRILVTGSAGYLGEADDVVRELLTDAELDDKRRGWSRHRNIGQTRGQWLTQ
jgi:nucleoside-diphosphate-sugar epimerase